MVTYNKMLSLNSQTSPHNERLHGPTHCLHGMAGAGIKGIKSVQSKKTVKMVMAPENAEALVKFKLVWSKGGLHQMVTSSGLSPCYISSGVCDWGNNNLRRNSVCDVAVDHRDNPQVLKVQIKASKTDLFRLGVDILVSIPTLLFSR